MAGLAGRLRGVGPARAALIALMIVFSLLAIREWLPDSHGDEGWPLHGRDSGEQRFSPADQIDRETIKDLGLAWYHEFDTDRGQQATPIVVDGVLYVSSAWSKVYAFDAVTGNMLWSFDPEVPHATLGKGCCDAVTRGVAVDQGKVFAATLDGRLIALDSKTGRPLWSMMTVDPGGSYTITGAPRVAKGKVIIGNAGAEFGVRGYVSAYDAVSGALAWRFYTVPSPDGQPDGAASDRILAEKASGTWFGEKWKITGGGGTVWDAIVYDPETDLLFVGVGNGTPHNHALRSDGKGDNLFLSSILALRPDTGEYVWHYQQTPGDSWDFTSTQPIILADLEFEGRPRKIMMHAPKNGFFYVLDRTSGRLLSARNFVDVNWATGIDLKSGRPIENPAARYTNKPFLQMPGSLGAHSWHPMAYSPTSGLVYIPAQIIAQQFASDRSYRFRKGQMNLGLDLADATLPDDPVATEAIRKAVHGELIAWDPIKQERRWSVRHPSFLNGGVLALGGGIVMQGTAEGQLLAFDDSDGTKLWGYDTANGIVAPPISYTIKGVQYVAVMVGYGGPGAMLGTIVPDRPRLPGRLLVFKLGGTAVLPPQRAPEPSAPILAGVRSPGDIERGRIMFNANCMVCHGFNARSGFNADLRRSGALTAPEAWRSVVVEGALADNGMRGFGAYLSPADAEDIRAYVLREAKLLETGR